MNEAHKKLRESIKFAIEVFEKENRVTVLKIKIRRHGRIDNDEITSIHIPIAPK